MISFKKTAAILLFYVSLVVTADEDVTPFQCGDISTAAAIPSNGSNSTITSVLIGSHCDGHYCDFLIPKEIHWHIYPLPTDIATPRQQMFPEGLFEPQISSNGVLSYTIQDVLETQLDFQSGESVQAGVSLYLPLATMSSIRIEGVDQSVQIHADDDSSLTASQTPLRITNSGVDVQVLVSSPYRTVQYVESGVDNSAWLDVANDSSVDVSGVDIDAYIKCADGLTVHASGVDNDIFVEGPVYVGTLSGIDANLDINNDGNTNVCANVTNSGIGNRCDDTDDLFETDELTCFADTKAGYYCNGWWGWSSMSTAGQVALSVGAFLVFVAIVGGLIFCCARGCCCCNKNNRAYGAPVTTTTPYPNNAAIHETKNSYPQHQQQSPPMSAFPTKGQPNDTLKSEE